MSLKRSIAMMWTIGHYYQRYNFWIWIRPFCYPPQLEKVIAFRIICVIKSKYTYLSICARMLILANITCANIDYIAVIRIKIIKHWISWFILRENEKIPILDVFLFHINFFCISKSFLQWNINIHRLKSCMWTT